MSILQVRELRQSGFMSHSYYVVELRFKSVNLKLNKIYSRDTQMQHMHATLRHTIEILQSCQDYRNILITFYDKNSTGINHLH